MRFYISTIRLNEFNHYAHPDCADDATNGYGNLVNASESHVSSLASLWGFSGRYSYDSGTDRYVFTVRDEDRVQSSGIANYGQFGH